MSKRKKAAKAALKRKPTSGIASPRDGATDEYAKHHKVVARSAGIGGQKVRTQLEGMMETDQISPDQCHAGWRFSVDYLVGVEAPGGGSLSFKIGRGDGHPSETRLDATQAHRMAKDALEKRCKAQRDPQPTITMIKFLVEDRPVTEIAYYSPGGPILPLTVKRRILRSLEILTEHYQNVDVERGRSTTVHTKEAARKLFDPIDKRNPMMD